MMIIIIIIIIIIKIIIIIVKYNIKKKKKILKNKFPKMGMVYEERILFLNQMILDEILEAFEAKALNDNHEPIPYLLHE